MSLGASLSPTLECEKRVILEPGRLASEVRLLRPEISASPPLSKAGRNTSQIKSKAEFRALARAFPGRSPTPFHTPGRRLRHGVPV